MKLPAAKDVHFDMTIKDEGGILAAQGGCSSAINNIIHYETKDATTIFYGIHPVKDGRSGVHKNVSVIGPPNVPLAAVTGLLVRLLPAWADLFRPFLISQFALPVDNRKKPWYSVNLKSASSLCNKHVHELRTAEPVNKVMDWKSAAEAKRNSILNQIPGEWRIPPLPAPEALRNVTGDYIRQYLTSRETGITESDAVDIVHKTTGGEWTAKEVTTAFCHRAALAHQMVSCLHEIFFDQAIKDAEQLDAYYQKYGKPVGPLHGLPISLKDSIHVKGVETTLGYVGWIGTFEGDKNSEKYKTAEAAIATHLRTLGAILYVKTSVPQASCSAETGNNIIDYTTNPHNRALTAGGSSGGEGALIALRGSPVGLGTDIGASIRLPSHFNGLHGLRPSFYRLPLRGIATSMDGQDTIQFVVGPMATTSRAAVLLTKSLLSCEPWLSDPLVHEIPWRDDMYQETLRRASGVGRRLAFGILRSDKVATPQPPIARALDIMESAIRRAGHEVIEFSLPNYSDALELFFKACFIDGGADVIKQFALSGEPPYPTTPAFFHTKSPKVVDATEVMRTNKAIRAYRAEFLDHWNATAKATATEQAVDAVIMPITPSAAPKKGNVRWMGYTALINLLDLASYAIPVTRANKAVDVPSTHAPVSEEDEFLLNDYDPDLYHGAPVGLQIVGRRLQEEKVLALGEFFTDAISKEEA